MIKDFTLAVNGRRHQVRVEPDTPLIYVLRNDLGLKGAKFGCGMAQCGACRVLVDGRAVPSCGISVQAAEDTEIVTVEGLDSDGELHPIQEAFIAEQAAQCGYCTSGMIITAKALLDRNPSPTDEEIKVAMAGNLCRCAGYEQITEAVLTAAEEVGR